MKRVAKADARMRFAEIVTKADGGERVKITHYGKTIAVLISKDDLRRLQECESMRAAKRSRSTDGSKAGSQVGHKKSRTVRNASTPSRLTAARR